MEVQAGNRMQRDDEDVVDDEDACMDNNTDLAVEELVLKADRVVQLEPWGEQEIDLVAVYYYHCYYYFYRCSKHYCYLSQNCHCLSSHLATLVDKMVDVEASVDGGDVHIHKAMVVRYMD